VVWRLAPDRLAPGSVPTPRLLQPPMISYRSPQRPLRPTPSAASARPSQVIGSPSAPSVPVSRDAPEDPGIRPVKLGGWDPPSRQASRAVSADRPWLLRSRVTPTVWPFKSASNHSAQPRPSDQLRSSGRYVPAGRTPTQKIRGGAKFPASGSHDEHGASAKWSFLVRPSFFMYKISGYYKSQGGAPRGDESGPVRSRAKGSSGECAETTGVWCLPETSGG